MRTNDQIVQGEEKGGVDLLRHHVKILIRKLEES